jgi:hypothetical protein
MLLDGYDKQNSVSNRLPMPVDVLADTAFLNDITGETLQLYFWSTGTLTIDAGQLAGVVVTAKFAYSGILDSLGAMIGNAQDTSIAFTTGTILTTEVPLDYSQVEAADNATLEEIAIDVTENMANGEYAIDYRNGVLYGLKATAGVSDTVAYKVSTQTSGGGGSITASQDLQSIVGTAVSAKNAAFAEAPLGVGGEFEAVGALTADGGTAGDKTPLKTSAEGVLYGHQVTVDGGLSIGVVDDDAQAATPGMLNVGGEYRAADTTYADGDATIVQTDVNGALKIRSKAYDSSTQADKTAEVNPLNQQYVPATLIDETNITTNTTTYAYFDMSGYKYFSLQGETSGTAPTDVLTVTIEATTQDDGTAQASCAYQDVTNSLFGVASFVDTDFYGIADEVNPFKYVRVKYVTSNGSGSDADLTVYLKKLY